MQSYHHLPPGSYLRQGQYQVETVLGEGGFGITYRAVDRARTRRIALKENWPEKATRQGTTIVWPHTVSPKQRRTQLEKVSTEASYLARCQHPNIVPVYDWFEENNTAYVVMGFVAGQPLADILAQRGRLPQQQAKRYFLQLAAALQVVHGANLLHRDIKPGNILIDDRDRAVLIDFGATKEFIAGQTRAMSVTLTPGYAPLEQYSYNSKRWPATDIYALCASMYELVTGVLPASAVDRTNDAKALIPPRQFVPDIDPRLETAILRGMEIKVDDRLQTADDLMLQLTGGETIAWLQPQYPIPGKADIWLEGNSAIVGRWEAGEPAIDIDLGEFSGADTVSRRHAQLYRQRGQWHVKDLGSTNGIFIKPRGETRFRSRLDRPSVLNSGDDIALGRVCFSVQLF